MALVPYRCGAARRGFPRGPLHHWQLPHKGYDGPDGGSNRETIIEGISPRIEMADDLRARCQKSVMRFTLCCVCSQRARQRPIPHPWTIRQRRSWKGGSPCTRGRTLTTQS